MMFLNPFTTIKTKMKLTHPNTPANLTPLCNSKVGFSGSDYKGDNTPQSLAVFLCLPFFGFLKFKEANIIMTALFWQPFRLVVPLYDTANQLNAVTRFLAVLRDGFTPLNKGITA